jgi:PAS domain S-box-containing protein
MKIANKISLGFFAVTVLCTAAALSVLYSGTRDNLRQVIEAKLEAVARSRADHIETYLGMLRISVGQLSKSVVLENLLNKDNLWQSKEFEVAAARLRRTKESNPAIHEFLLLDKTGRVIAATDAKSIGADKSADAYFLGAQKEIFIKDAYYSEEMQEPLLAVSAPMTDSQSGDLLGMLVARVKLNDLWRIAAERTGLGASGEIYVVNQNGFMITPSRFVEDTFLKQKVDTENLRQARLPTGREHPLPCRTIVFPDYRGKMVLGTHAWIPEMQWAVLAEMNTREAFAPLAELRRIILAILLIMAVAAWLLSRGIAGLIAGPIRKLHEGTEIIGSGNLDYKVGTDTRDEVGQLARAFDAMTENLKTTTTSVANLNKEIAARKLTQEKLLQSTEELFEREEDLAITLRSIGDAVIATDTGGRVTKMNPVAEHLTGWSFAEAAGKPLENIFRIINAQTRAPAPNPIARVLASGKVVGLANHTALIARDGTVRQIADSAAPIRDADGRIRGVVLVFRDATAEYQAKEALRKKTEELHKLSQAVEQSPAIVVITDPAGNIEYVNPKFSQVTGYESAEALGQNPRILKSGELSAETYKQLWTTITSGGEWRGEFHNKKKDGTLYWESALIAPVLDANGRIVHFMAIKEDITARKRAQEELEHSREQFDLAVRGSQDGIWDWNLRDKSLYISPRWKQMIGYDDAELPNAFASFEERIHPEDKPRVLEYVDRYLKGRIKSYDIEFRFRHRDGSYRWILARGEALRDQDGKPYRMAGSHTDITARKESEEKIAAKLDELRRWQSVMIDRETRNLALKREVNELLTQAGQPPRYPSAS